MQTIEMKFFNQIHPKLKPYVKHYWHTSGAINNKNALQVLPTSHVDLIIPTKGIIKYLIDGKEYLINDNIVHGLRKHSIHLYQDSFVEAYGITFTPAGFYGIANKSLDVFTNKMIKLKNINKPLEHALGQVEYTKLEENKIIEHIENALIKEILETDKYMSSMVIINSFLETKGRSVKEFCEAEGIQRKRLERIFKKYVGLSPKDYISTRQFEEASRKVIHEEGHRLTDVAYDELYADQSHFSKRFKNYTSLSPSQFKKSDSALKSKMK